MKERKICRCGRIYWVGPPKKGEDALKYELKSSLCQKCRNGLNREREGLGKGIVQKMVDDNLRRDVLSLIWLERNRPDLVEKLRLKPRKRLNKTGRLGKGRCLVT